MYYYICGRNKQERGHHCDYKASLRKTDIEPLVIEAVKELVSDKYFAKEIEKRIGVQTDTTAIDKELANYESKLKEVDLIKPVWNERLIICLLMLVSEKGKSTT